MEHAVPREAIKDLIRKSWQNARRWAAPERLRRYRSLLFQLYVLAALLAFSILALAASVTEYLEFDLEATRELQSEIPPGFGLMMQAISWPGYTIQAVIIVALVVILLSAMGLRWEALTALFAAGSSTAINYMIKIVIRRPRPTGDLVDVFQTLDSYSFPSGHVMFYTAFFGFLLFLAFILPRRSLQRTLTMVFLALMISLVGFSRMYLGEHWASDVIGGYLLGSLALLLTIEFYRWGKTRYFTGQPLIPDTGYYEEEDPYFDPKAIARGVAPDERDSTRPRPKQRT